MGQNENVRVLNEVISDACNSPPQESKSHLGPAAPENADPVIEYYKKDVDRTLLRENLKLTVEERFQKFQRFMEFAEGLRAAGQKARRRES